MKIINRVEFLKLPSGTLYREFRPCVFGELTVKGDTNTPHEFESGGAHYVATDFNELHLDLIDEDSGNEAIDAMYRAMETGESFRFDYDGWMRNGWSPEQDKKLYAVYESEDVQQLIGTLQRLCLKL